MASELSQKQIQLKEQAGQGSQQSQQGQSHGQPAKTYSFQKYGEVPMPDQNTNPTPRRGDVPWPEDLNNPTPRLGGVPWPD